MDGIEHNDALKNNRGDELNNTWTSLLKELGCYDGLEDHINFLRQRWVLGAAEWMAGSNGSKQNQKEVLGYSDSEWEYIWSTLIENGAWAVPPVRDAFGNWKKENCAPEILIQFIAHDLGCHIIVFDLLLNRIQFCSGNHVLDDNIKFDSPILLYSTGSHFQSVFQKDHDHFIGFARELENQQVSVSEPSSNIETTSNPHSVPLLKQESTSTRSKRVQSHICSGRDPQSFEKLEPGSTSKGSMNVSSQNSFHPSIQDCPLLEPGTIHKRPNSLSSLGIEKSKCENISESSNKSGLTEMFKQYGGSVYNSPPITPKNPTDVLNRFSCHSNHIDDSPQNVDNNLESQEMKLLSETRTKEHEEYHSQLGVNAREVDEEGITQNPSLASTSSMSSVQSVLGQLTRPGAIRAIQSQAETELGRKLDHEEETFLCSGTSPNALLDQIKKVKLIIINKFSFHNVF